MRLNRQHDVLQQGHVLKHAGDLERPGEAEMRARRHGGFRDLLAVEQDLAGIRFHLAGQLRDQRRLAGAVRANDRVKLALLGLPG